MKDIASVVGQIQPQVAVNQYPSSGLGSAVNSFVQPAQPSFTSYQAMQQQPVQATPAAFEQPQYSQPVAPAYNPPQRQASPPPNAYYNQGYGAEQSFKSEPSYAKQEIGTSRSSYGAPPVRQSTGGYASELVPSRVILIKNLPEDYSW